MPAVTVNHLHKKFGEVVVLDDVSLDIRDGEFFTLLGPSGCGKSTTLSCLAGLERPTTGSITVGDVSFFDDKTSTFVPPEARNLGMVFQSYALWPHMTLAQNVGMPLKIRRVPKADQQALVHDALEKVRLDHLKDRYPHQLSGGQQQRVALARALVYSPRVLLLDEPLSNLDAKLREQARVWLKRLQTDLGITTIYVTHDQEEALAMSDRIAVMSQGQLMQVGTPTEIYEQPATAEVAAFIGRSNFLDGSVTHRSGDSALITIEGTREVVQVLSESLPADTDDVTIAFRPERATLADSTESAPPMSLTLAGEVLNSSYVGSRVEYSVRVGARTVLADHQGPAFEGSVAVVVPADRVRVYPRTHVLSQDVEVLMATV